MTPEELLLVQANRLTILRSVASGYAHNMRGPIQSIMMAADGLASGDPEDLEILLPALRSAAEGARSSLDSLSDLFRVDGPEPGPVPLAPLLRKTCLVGSAMHPPRVEPNFSGDDTLPAIRGTDADIELVLLNLISNAGWATRGVGDATVTVSARPEGETVVVSVSDNGPGISEELSGDPFDPFVTTRPGAMGIGLTAARVVAVAVGASISIGPGPGGRGTTAEAAFARWTE